MTFFVCMPVCFSWMPCAVMAWNDWNTSAFFDPTNKLVAVIAFIRQNQLPCQRKRLQYFSRQANVIPVSTGK